MKKIGIIVFLFTCNFIVKSQNYYWVFFTDKTGTTFNPYEYFDTKAIERRLQNQITLYDSTDFPLNKNYVHQITTLSEEVVGETRWFNALAVVATVESIEKMGRLPFVKEIVIIDYQAELTSTDDHTTEIDTYLDTITDSIQIVYEQLKRMGGDLFVKEGLDGKGIRIAVFDGGFPSVDKHDAFKHLRENHQIIKTWNFPLKKENVYGWNSHGTMTLSCITGIEDSLKIGLATGAEFLLARTEVGTEPALEEVWWMQAVEWADRNGANMISSSLGYGESRHKISDMNGKKCLVSRAANLAASKGILVCNSMGNEGEKNTWRTLIAPADADSVLAVGGINPFDDKHTDFSSYGPTFDGRIKPNVCAYATDCEVAKPCKEKDEECDLFDRASGTSFSCPLVAGFAACAWQKYPELTAMELKKAIEQSADLFPYYDYSYGYGVPQATYFLYPKNDSVIKTFEIVFDSTYIIIKPFEINPEDKIFYHIQYKDSILSTYENLYFTESSEKELKIYKSALYKNKILRVYYKGYVESYTLSEEDIRQLEALPAIDETETYEFNFFYEDYKPSSKLNTYGYNAIHFTQLYLSWGFSVFNKEYNPTLILGKSNNFNVGFRYKGNITKWYSLGLALEYNKVDNCYNKIIYTNMIPSEPYKLIYSRYSNHCLNIEFYQRFRIISPNRMGIGCFLDLGAFVGWNFADNYMIKYKNEGIITEKYTTLKSSSLVYGMRTRLGYGMFAVYTDLYNVNKLSYFYNIGIQYIMPF